MTPNDSRFLEVSRRSFLRRAAAAAGGASALAILAACGSSSDADVLGADTSSAPTSPPTSTAESAAGVPTTSAAPTTTATAATTAPTTSTAPAGPPLADTAELQIAFTFAVSQSGFPAKNPYLAVWIEDAAGELVRTVGVWIESGRGERYWHELNRWYQQESAMVSAGGTAEAITGATRTPGDISVVWDGTDLAGAKVGAGSYFVCIEGAREHGPYELIREPLELGASAFTKALGPQGELTAASVAYVV